MNAPTAIFAASLMLAACSDGDRARTPDGVVRQLVASARAGNRGGVYRLLGPATRARLEGLSGVARRMSGRVPLAPSDFLSVGWAPPAWEPSGFRTVRRDDASADVEVYSASGDRHTVHLVREAEEWRIELPGG